MKPTYRLKSAPVPRPDYYPTPDPMPFGWGDPAKELPHIRDEVKAMLDDMAIGEERDVTGNPRLAMLTDYVTRSRLDRKAVCVVEQGRTWMRRVG
jgi:hypothetical protein